VRFESTPHFDSTDPDGRTLASTSASEFMPVCAIIGGVMGQDVLNTLGGREPPVVNLFVYNGTTGSGDFYQLGITLSIA
jgi:ubiquitin-like 1-activating enzyme E1 A